MGRTRCGGIKRDLEIKEGRVGDVLAGPNEASVPDFFKISTSNPVRRSKVIIQLSSIVCPVRLLNGASPKRRLPFQTLLSRQRFEFFSIVSANVDRL